MINTMVTDGTPTNNVRPKSTRLGEMPVTIVTPPVYAWATPPRIAPTPSVVMMALTRNRVTTSPLMYPIRAPSARPISTATGAGRPYVDIAAPVAICVRHAMAPTDKSKLRQIMGASDPTARTPRIAWLPRTDWMFAVVRKWDDVAGATEKKMKVTTSS